MSNPWIDQSTQVRKGEELPIETLQAYLLENLPGAEGNLSVEQFPSGYSNLTYLIRMGERGYVLRRPPFGAKIKTGHDMLREYTVLSALKKQYDKVPEPLLYTDDESVIGAPFYVMERVEGVILRAKMPKEMRPDAETMSGIAQSLIDTFVELHAIDYRAAGLESFGKPTGYVERQIKGWTKRYFNAKTDEAPELERAAQWLADHLPPENLRAPMRGRAGAALIHNDFKYDNVVLDPKDWARIIAILDWEMATLGDPLMDLGASLGYWVNADDPPWLQQLALSPTTLPGNPSRGEVVERYSRQSGRNVDHLVFYYVYGLFRVAVIVQQIYYRYQKGLTKDPRFATLNQVVLGLGTMAMMAIRKKRVDGLW
jgi:aminoglycoside phosphotransferase (APT) family kinase protein